jgi:mannosyltransferase
VSPESSPTALVVHPHFHARRSGATTHVEAVLPGIARVFEARALGDALDPALPRIRWPELWRRIRAGPVVWHAHRNNELALGLVLRWLGCHVRLVFTRHASVQPGWLTRTLMRRADQVVSLTPDIAQSVSLPSTVVAHGVDLNRFRPPGDRDRAWLALGQGGQFGIGVLGRIRPEKGQADFVEATRPLLAAHPEWRAVFVGTVRPKHRAFAERLARQGGPALAFVGEQADIRPWYQGLSVVVHPSYTEGFSLVTAEAMASGCCVVASRLPYVDGLIEHGRTGFVFPPGDVGALAEVLTSLLRDPARARAVGQAAAEEARRRLGVDEEVRRLLDVYRPLLATP